MSDVPHATQTHTVWEREDMSAAVTASDTWMLCPDISLH